MNRIHTAFRLLCLGILLLAVVEAALVRPAKSAESGSPVVEAAGATGAAESGTATKAVEDKAPVAREPYPTELENKRLQLESRERELDDHEARVKEREKDLDKKLEEMERLRAAVSGELEGQRKSNDDRIQKLVLVFESMTPKSASAVLETLDEWLAVDVLKRMDTKRVAKVMNIMDKSRSAKLSELMTGYYRPGADRKVSSHKKSADATGQAAPTAPKGAPVAAPAGSGVAQAARQQQQVVPPALPQSAKDVKKGGE